MWNWAKYGTFKDFLPKIYDVCFCDINNLRSSPSGRLCFRSCESHLTPAWWMTFLSSSGQEVFYGALPPWKALAHFDASTLAVHSWQGQKAGAVYHPAASPAFPGWIYQLLADGPWHLLICDDHHKPYIIKCHTPALARVRNWSNARHGSGSK